ncbi:MAG: Leucine-rich repeat (LRR) protein, partial [Planctomycetota bacterium]
MTRVYLYLFTTDFCPDAKAMKTRLIIPLLFFAFACQDAPTPPTATDVTILIDHTTFADQGLEKAVRAALEKPRGELALDELLALETLDASQRDIQTLEGIERLGGLRSLRLGANQLEILTPLASLTELQFLDLSDNAISDFAAIASLTSLTTLDLSANAITNLELLGQLQQLAYLDLKNNAISDIDALADLRRLRLLSLDNNLVRDIEPLMGLRLLTDLELSGNPIDDIDALETLERRGVQVHYYVPFENPFELALEEDIRAHLNDIKGPLTDKLLEQLTFLNTTGPIQSLNGLDRLSNVVQLFIRYSSESASRAFTDLTPL